MAVIVSLAGEGGSVLRLPMALAASAVFVAHAGLRHRDPSDAAPWLVTSAVVVAALGAGRVVAGGHSYGGAVAIELALSRPDLVAGLVLFDTGAKLRVHPDILVGAEALAVDPAWAANLADWRACDAFDRRAEVATIRVPTLVLTGADDALTPPRYAEFLGQRIAGATVVLVPGAGHEAPSSHPVAVAAAIGAFLGAD